MNLSNFPKCVVHCIRHFFQQGNVIDVHKPHELVLDFEEPNCDGLKRFSVTVIILLFGFTDVIFGGIEVTIVGSHRLTNNFH